MENYACIKKKLYILYVINSQIMQNFLYILDTVVLMRILLMISLL